jgi:hypothetical protein
MPCVELYQNKKSGDIVLCSFVFCKELGGGNTPTGPLVKIPLEEFVKKAADITTKEFELFYTRDYEVKSELYDGMTEAQQKRFFSEHKKVIIDRPFKDGLVEVYVGPNDDLYGKLGFPFDKATFARYIIEAFSKLE